MPPRVTSFLLLLAGAAGVDTADPRGHAVMAPLAEQALVRARGALEKAK